MAISAAVRQRVRFRAKFLCEYCHSPEEISAARFEIDHIQPRSRGGSDSLDNLALACQRCNAHHYNFINGRDPETWQEVALFHPCQQAWNEHFIWTQAGVKILGLTETGRATVVRFDLNDKLRGEGAIMQAREAWVIAGWHPPIDDLQQTES